eukprot:1196128-Prorocentrum_minimum.AAC.5
MKAHGLFIFDAYTRLNVCNNSQLTCTELYSGVRWLGLEIKEQQARAAPFLCPLRGALLYGSPKASRTLSEEEEATLSNRPGREGRDTAENEVGDEPA